MSLVIEEVTKMFGDYRAVDDLSLTIEQGVMHGFLGANGAGKTTTFRMILGILQPTEGKITWNGEPVTYETSPQIGYLPEERGLYPKMKVEDQLVYLGQLRGMSKQAAKTETANWLKKMEIPHYAGKKVEELSKGNQQKVQVISALVHRPKLLILDEPFSGLDPVNVQLLKNAIIECRNEGATIVFSSHRMDHVEELCEQLSIIDKGKQIVSGKLREIKRNFGKQNVRIRVDGDLKEMKHVLGATVIERSIEGVVFQIEEERVAQQLLEAAIVCGPVRHFSIEEPSLQEIFIEVVGGQHA